MKRLGFERLNFADANALDGAFHIYRHQEWPRILSKRGSRLDHSDLDGSRIQQGYLGEKCAKLAAPRRPR